jgi:hypothetical protein
MQADNPYPCPAPCILADQLAMHSWSEHIDDQTRMLLEWGADTIRALIVLNNKLSNRAEHLEAEAATYAAILYGPQKGGAA